jgi:hypothetical protein
MEMERAKALVKINIDKEENKRKLFDDILMHVSLPSEQRIRQHAQFTNAEERVSPWMLWNIVRDTHLVRQFVGRIGLIGLRRDLVGLQIGKKSIAQHAREFKSVYDTLVAMGDDVITPQASADFFLTSLGPDFSAELNRWGRDDIIPVDLDEAIREASLYLESERNATKMMERNSGRHRGTHPKEDREVALTVKVPNGTHICPHCHKIAKHSPEQCYELPANKKAASGPKKAHAAAVSEEDPPPSAGGGKKSKPSWSINVSVICVASSPPASIIFDNGANTNLWNTETGLEAVTPLADPVPVSGVGKITASKKGRHPIFGDVFIAHSSGLALYPNSLLRSPSSFACTMRTIIPSSLRSLEKFISFFPMIMVYINSIRTALVTISLLRI